MSAPPVLVRIAGLSARSVQPFSHELSRSLLTAAEEVQENLARCRAQIVDLLSAAIPRVGPQLRRVLLAARRDCFNGRSLHRYEDSSESGELLRITGGLLDEALAFEVVVKERQAAFARAYEREREREREHIFSLLRDARFLRGVALGNPEIARRARAPRHTGDGEPDRRERKLAQTILRFGVRAALKLSPYSTLTSLALATVQESPEISSFQYAEGSCCETALVRVDRSLLDRCQVALLGHPSVRRCCLVALNDTVEETAPGRFRLLRAGGWRLDPGSGAFHYEAAAQVNGKFAGPILASLRLLLRDGPLTLDSLLAKLASELREEPSGDMDGRIRAGVDRLISVGFLNLLPPWPTHEIHLERRLLAFLRSLPADPSLVEIVASLENLVALEGEHVRHPEPEHSIGAILQALGSVAAAAARLAGLAPLPNQAAASGIFEDVFLLSRSRRSAEQEVLQISAARVEEIMRTVELVARYASLYNHRHDILHTLAAFWNENWPQREEVSFLELFHQFQPLWREYLRFDVKDRYFEFSTFNPLHLDEIDALGRLRSEFPSQIKRCLGNSPDGATLSPADLAKALDLVPHMYLPLFGSCAFLQPADSGGSLWVLNRIFEGSGRYMSRYCAAMEEPMLSRFIGHFTSRSVITLDGERAELLDLLFTHGSMTNLRRPQTSRVLALPGEHIDLPRHRLVGLGDLKVRANLPASQFSVLDPSGNRLVPVHMSSLNNLFMPVVLRFLSVFGPYETRQVFPRSAPQDAGSALVTDRLSCGNVVIRRKRWEIRDHAGGAGPWDTAPASAFAWAQKWRTRLGLPLQAFVHEQMHEGTEAIPSFKPQYIDFRSPSLVSLLMAILKKNTERLIFDEPLPTPSNFPLDPMGEPRAFELQIDSLGLLERRSPPG